MKLTTKGRYAVAAILDIALRKRVLPVSLTDIALKQNISISYLEQIFSKLRAAGLVKSMKGPGGGYMITRSLDQISIKEVIDAVGEKLEMTKCGKDFSKGCVEKGIRCSTHDLWEELGNRINGYLRGISIADLISKHYDIPRSQ
ncbi:BadM/Rrf2 family transcriptional regulator [Candidatus Phycorickettsia trachydisci]|uniref:BadM/Rrf2 family transcriptional regulator n=1 Tax=Candidatus Phycorickettsia trachydisci TaxID=2115978 RepID=A0A2P1P846_9RICK|nr:Rrf2 family transcriptional regulator [Candidatus Phycorickettsia trachydisci]AVP87449.1 BadM/Rrf2 family transcriptional regulator [Candidatus Phycorickettsia trachydisci]